GSREDEIDTLNSLQREGVTIIVGKENIGYARAVNIGIAQAKGDFVLITNPDVLYEPESIQHMMQLLKEFRTCGAVGPRTWWDRSMSFFLPYADPATPLRILGEWLMGISQSTHEILLRRWMKKMLRFWLSKNPSKQETLSGASIMTTKRVFDRVGGFDESFALYFEDTDWCLRVKRAGYDLYLEPRAHIIHYYNQSAKLDIASANKKFDDSRNLYMRKHFKWRRLLTASLPSSAKPTDIARRYADMGQLSSPPRFSTNIDADGLFLLSPVATLIPSAGAFFRGDTFEIPSDIWDRLGSGRYFARAFEMDHLKDCGSWTWIK
ncbi:MAG: glycosyltransferase, partial [Nitrospirota bacterium]